MEEGKLSKSTTSSDLDEFIEDFVSKDQANDTDEDGQEVKREKVTKQMSSRIREHFASFIERLVAPRQKDVQPFLLELDDEDPDHSYTWKKIVDTVKGFIKTKKKRMLSEA